MTRFGEMFNARVAAGFPACVGLDPDYERIPEDIRKSEGRPVWAIREFLTRIVDQTGPVAGAFKLDLGFYIEYGSEGVAVLEGITRHIQMKFPKVPIILDSKPGGTGGSNLGYANFAFNILGVEALTIHGFPGYEDGIKSFFATGKQIFLWIRSSNKSGEVTQNVTVNNRRFSGGPYWQYLAHVARWDWSEFNNLGFVVGATHPKDIRTARGIIEKGLILAPGIGAQEGNLKAVVQAGATKGTWDEPGINLVVSSSRGIIYDQDPENATDGLNSAIMTIWAGGDT